MATVHLVINESGGESHRVPFDQEELTFGRSNDNDIVLAKDFISRRHAKFFRSGEFFYVADLGSSGGLFVDGRQNVGAPMRINNGSKIQIGELTITLEIE